MKRSNRKRKLKGLPLWYKKRVTNQIIPFAYKCEELKDIIITNTGNIASKSDINRFSQYYVRFCKKGYDENIAAYMARDYIKDKGITIDKYIRAKRKLEIKKEKQRLKKLKKKVS